jgi:hypothetical protein
MKSPYRIIFPWALSAVVSALAVYVWGSGFAWDIHALNAYLFFPVLGLQAFSLMWAHYMVGAVKDSWLAGLDLKPYFRYTGYVVLGAIVLHPGILIYQLFHDGFGLPPSSYEHYVGPGLGWVTLLGTVSLLTFLAFELHRFYSDRPWWKYVVSAGDVAMVAIFYHGLRLGSQLQGGWYRGVWWVYGVTLIAALVRKYVLVFKGTNPVTNDPAKPL